MLNRLDDASGTARADGSEEGARLSVDPSLARQHEAEEHHDDDQVNTEQRQEAISMAGTLDCGPAGAAGGGWWPSLVPGELCASLDVRVLGDALPAAVLALPDKEPRRGDAIERPIGGHSFLGFFLFSLVFFPAALITAYVVTDLRAAVGI
jgi:hypothetical protein